MNFTFDFNRKERTGLSEAIFCQGKQSNILTDMILFISGKKIRTLLTRLSQAQYNELDKKIKKLLDYHPLSETAFLACKKKQEIKTQKVPAVAILTGGSADLKVAWEAKRTLDFLQADSRILADLGIAGIWRLQEKLEQIKKSQVVIVCSGMEASLPTVLGGLIKNPIIAIPTSHGYGVSRDGQPALYSILASCSPGIVTVNIDNGFGAACAAYRILSAIKK